VAEPIRANEATGTGATKPARATSSESNPLSEISAQVKPKGLGKAIISSVPVVISQPSVEMRVRDAGRVMVDGGTTQNNNNCKMQCNISIPDSRDDMSQVRRNEF
jgi:hypothetical protein